MLVFVLRLNVIWFVPCIFCLCWIYKSWLVQQFEYVSGGYEVTMCVGWLSEYCVNLVGWDVCFVWTLVTV